MMMSISPTVCSKSGFGCEGIVLSLPSQASEPGQFDKVHHMAHASFDGLRVLSLESRREKEVDNLIRTYRGQPFVVPAMREVKLESNQRRKSMREIAEAILPGDDLRKLKN